MLVMPSKLADINLVFGRFACWITMIICLFCCAGEHAFGQKLITRLQNESSSNFDRVQQTKADTYIFFNDNLLNKISFSKLQGEQFGNEQVLDIAITNETTRIFVSNFIIYFGFDTIYKYDFEKEVLEKLSLKSSDDFFITLANDQQNFIIFEGYQDGKMNGRYIYNIKQNTNEKLPSEYDMFQFKDGKIEAKKFFNFPEGPNYISQLDLLNPNDLKIEKSWKGRIPASSYTYIDQDLYYTEPNMIVRKSIGTNKDTIINSFSNQKQIFKISSYGESLILLRNISRPSLNREILICNNHGMPVDSLVFTEDNFEFNYNFEISDSILLLSSYSCTKVFDLKYLKEIKFPHNNISKHGNLLLIQNSEMVSLYNFKNGGTYSLPQPSNGKGYSNVSLPIKLKDNKVGIANNEGFFVIDTTSGEIKLLQKFKIFDKGLHPGSDLIKMGEHIFLMHSDSIYEIYNDQLKAIIPRSYDWKFEEDFLRWQIDDGEFYNIFRYLNHKIFLEVKIRNRFNENKFLGVTKYFSIKGETFVTIQEENSLMWVNPKTKELRVVVQAVSECIQVGNQLYCFVNGNKLVHINSKQVVRTIENVKLDQFSTLSFFNYGKNPFLNAGNSIVLLNQYYMPTNRIIDSKPFSERRGKYLFKINYDGDSYIFVDDEWILLGSKVFIPINRNELLYRKSDNKWYFFDIKLRKEFLLSGIPSESYPFFLNLINDKKILGTFESLPLFFKIRYYEFNSDFQFSKELYSFNSLAIFRKLEDPNVNPIIQVTKSTNLLNKNFTTKDLKIYTPYRERGNVVSLQNAAYFLANDPTHGLQVFKIEYEYQPPTEQKPNEQFIIYPNPTMDVIVIDRALKDCSNFTVTNTIGQVVYQSSMYSTDLKVNELPRGNYSLTCLCNEETKSAKFIKI
jgi:hypothetical protein